MCREGTLPVSTCCLNPCTRQTGDELLQWLTFGALSSFENLPLWSLRPGRNEHMHLSTEFCNYSSREFKDLPPKCLSEPSLSAQSVALNKSDFSAL